MKKIIYFLLIIILLAGIVGGAYMCLKHFGKIGSNPTPVDTPAEISALSELIGDWQLTVGEGDNAIAFSNKTDVINVSDLRSKGKGIGTNDSGIAADLMTLENTSKTLHSLEIKFNVNPAVWSGEDFNLSSNRAYVSLKFKKDGTSFMSFQNIYENPLATLSGHIAEIENNVSNLEVKQLGTYLVTAIFAQQENFDFISDFNFKYTKSDERIPGMILFYTIPVYYVG